MPRRAINVRDGGLFPSEDEIAKRLSQAPAEWKALAEVLERHGLPRVDPFMGGRFWPAIEAYFRRRHGLDTVSAPQSGGQEDLGAF